MQEFVHITTDWLLDGQRRALQRFLEDVTSGRIPGSPGEIEALLRGAGDLIPLPDIDPTDPDGYNTALTTLLANISGLYQDCDRIETAQTRLAHLNVSELARVESAVNDLATLVRATIRAHRQNLQWSDIFVETFGDGVEREVSPDWYRPTPILATTDQIEAFVPAEIDPVDRSLRRAAGGDFLRSVTADGRTLASIRVDELLGVSSDEAHHPRYALDGRRDTYWRELVLSNGPIQADIRQVPWLPSTYSGGCAARLHIRFPFAVPFTDLVIRPFARFPVRVLQVVWDNRLEPSTNLIKDPDFASGTTHWTTGTASAIITFPSSGGYENRSHVNIESTSGRTILVSNSFSVSGDQAACHLHFKIYRQPGIQPRVIVEWKDGSGNQIRSDWDSPSVPENEWWEYSRLILSPTGYTTGTTGTVTLVADGSGTVKFTRVTFSRVSGRVNTDLQPEPGAEAITVPIQNKVQGVGTDIWIVLSQPHHEIVQSVLPEGDLDQAALWERVLVDAEAVADRLIRPDVTPWTIAGGLETRPPLALDEDGSVLVREAKRLAGRVRDLVVGLVRFANPLRQGRVIRQYLYVLGAWEIEVRHREYAPQSLFVSRPFRPRGEVREVVLLTNPSLRELAGRVQFWLTPRENDGPDRARRFDGRATFSASEEDAVYKASTHFTLTPIRISETLSGTDRHRRVALEDYPYINRDRIRDIQSQISSGTITNPLVYDPNRETYHLTDASGNIIAVSGYRPVRVTIQFLDGRVARPDLLGPVQIGDIGYVEKEILRTATIEDETLLLDQEEIERIERRVSRAPRNRQEELRRRLIESALKRAASKTVRKRSRRATPVALQTRFKNIVVGPSGPAISIYWHKSSAKDASGSPIVSGDVLIPPERYRVYPAEGIIVVRDLPPSGIAEYDSYIAYYYYHRTEEAGRQARIPATPPVSGVDTTRSTAQIFPVTRNMTDYVYGIARGLRPAQLDELSPDYYPVYEYIIDERGRLVFANDLSLFGDQPALIHVEYETLAIRPRLFVVFPKRSDSAFGSETPLIKDITLLFGTRQDVAEQIDLLPQPSPSRSATPI